MQTGSITWAFRAVAAATAAVAVCASALRGAAVFGQAPPGGGPSPAWRRAPGYAELFAPSAHRTSYQFFTDPRGIDELLREIVQDPASILSPGGWTARPLLPFEAFGQSGGYDRPQLARLYGSRRAQVARGPRQEGGVVRESWTLVSPYPDTSLTRLEPGTLLIVLRLP